MGRGIWSLNTMLKLQNKNKQKFLASLAVSGVSDQTKSLRNIVMCSTTEGTDIVKGSQELGM